MTAFSIALDGPSGAGKSTIAKALANALNARYLDTGAMYRTVGLYMTREGIVNDAEAVAARVTEVPLEVRFDGDKQLMFLGDEDVSKAIRQPEISMTASAMGAIPAVRSHLVHLQRELSHSISIIMDGRDIGTVVLPDATVKIFLTATPEARAQRRLDQLAKDNITEPYEKVLAEIIQRDYQDTHRIITPLKQADDAILVDTTELTEDETIETILRICREKIAQ